MSRNYQPQEHLDPRTPSGAQQPNTPGPPQHDEVREQAPNRPAQSSRDERDRVASRAREPRTVYELRGQTYRLRHSEIATMVELGKFRAVAGKDLAEFVYDGSSERMRPDIENLFRQGLVLVKSIPHEETGFRQLLSLTKRGHRFLTQTESAGKGQAVHHGFGRPRDAHHDADLYRLYQRVFTKIEGQGGRNLRVVLDSELKRRLYHDLAKLGENRNSAAAQQAIAEKHGLQVVRGKIPVPDVRIEYETPAGERARVDLELATSHYRGRDLSEKVCAGFSLYARADEVANLRRVLHQRKLTAEILSL
jgi:hypothetical protein